MPPPTAPIAVLPGCLPAVLLSIVPVSVYVEHGDEVYLPGIDHVSDELLAEVLVDPKITGTTGIPVTIAVLPLMTVGGYLPF